MSQENWLFIVGVPGSGTTLLDHLLSLHNDIDQIQGEGHDYMNNYPQKIRRERNYDVNVQFTEFLQYLDEKYEGPHQLKRKWLNARKTIGGKYVLVKTPTDLVRLSWLQKSFIPSSFLCVIRNGYSVVASYVRRGRDLRRVATHWNLANKMMVQGMNKLKRVLIVKYEELVEHPQITLSGIENFLRINNKDYSFLDDYVVPLEKPRYGNLHNSKIVNINKNPRIKLSQKQIDEIHEEANEMLEYFGYEPPIELRDI